MSNDITASPFLQERRDINSGRIPDEITINGVLYVRADYLCTKRDDAATFRDVCLENGITLEECTGPYRMKRFIVRRYAVISQLHEMGWGQKRIARHVCRDRSLVNRVVRGRL